MSEHLNHLGQPIGASLPNWQPCARPLHALLDGVYCRLEPLDATTHAEQLWASFAEDQENKLWTYLPYGPFDSQIHLSDWIYHHSKSQDPLFFAIIDKATGKASGVASYLRIQPEVGVVEVGHINYSPVLQKTRAATEAMYLMMKHAFELGYRRYEWKCDNHNAGSKQAAKRLGFGFDGLFKQATIYKNRNRDTAWFSVLDQNWPDVQARFEAWLSPENFNGHGHQIKKLNE